MANRVALPMLQRSSDSGWTMASCEYGVFKRVVVVGGGGGGFGGEGGGRGRPYGYGGGGGVLNMRVVMHICLL